LTERPISTPQFAARLPDELPSDPMQLAQEWIRQAETARLRRNANSMTVATVSSAGIPSARIVLCKQFVPDPGYLVFYTNYHSQKALEILENPNVAVVFHWDGPGRQIRIQGKAVRSPEAESDEYFRTRDRGAQIGAWGSDQSATLESRDALIAQIRQRAARLGVEFEAGTAVTEGGPTIPRPPHWGGIRVWANTIELWKDGADRIHDRALWKRELVRASEHEFTATAWTGTRLQP